jgi:preprotein translocase subunit SecA
MGQIHRFLGLEVGCIQNDMDDFERQAAYAADITYGTNNEFGFDYLRDNMKFDLATCVQRGHYFAIVDEVDSILIDEARTPLIISGPSDEATDKYRNADAIIPHLKKGEDVDGKKTGDYVVDEKAHTAVLTEEGVEKAERLLAVGNLYDPSNMELLHCVEQALKAHTLYKLDHQYVIQDGEVIIVDDFTGRLMKGRRWSDGRSEGRRRDREREPDSRNDHAAKLFPPLRKTLRHDWYRRNGSGGVRVDLQTRRHRDSDAHADGSCRLSGRHLSHAS